MTNEPDFISLPGLKTPVETLKKLLDASNSSNDHINIQGPRGAGKSYLVGFLKEYLWHYDQLEIDCEELNQDTIESWLSAYNKKEKLLILDNIQAVGKLSDSYSEEYKLLKHLFKKTRVVIVGRREELMLPPSIKDYLTCSVDIPPLRKRRDDIFYFLAQQNRDNNPGFTISSGILLKMIGYHWPGNLWELKRVIHCLKARAPLPVEFDSNGFFDSLFSKFADVGCDNNSLQTALRVCFAGLVPLGEGTPSPDLEFKFERDDPSAAIEVIIDPYFSDITLNEREFKYVIKSLLQLIYGPKAFLLDTNLSDVPCFGEDAIGTIDWALREVERWEPGQSSRGQNNLRYSLDPEFDNHFFSLPLFSENLLKTEIDATKTFLNACKKEYSKRSQMLQDISNPQDVSNQTESAHAEARYTIFNQQLNINQNTVNNIDNSRVINISQSTKTESDQRKQNTRNEDEAYQDIVIETSSSGPEMIDGRDRILAFFSPAVWNTVKKWMLEYGIPKPADGNTWRLPLLDAIEIKSQKASYYKKNKKM